MHRRYLRDDPPTSRAAVTAMHPHAAHAARDVLREGGSAHDAALTALATVSVAEPFMSGLGGHGALLVAPPDEAPYVLDASARGPGRPPTLPAPARGVQATSVAPAISGWIGLHEDGATRPLADLLTPAIQAGRDGLPTLWYTALMVASHGRLVRDDPEARDIFLARDGLPPQAASSNRTPGDPLFQTDLADTLDRVGRNGLHELTQGETANRIVQHVEDHGGFVTPSDLARIPPARPSPPLTGRFRDFTVHAGPNASAAASLIEMLHILEDLDPDQVPLGSPAYYAALADAQRAAFLDRDQHGDPDVVDSPLDAYQDPTLGRLRRGDLHAAAGRPLPARDLRAAGYPPHEPTALRDTGRDGASTTHVNVAAPDGTLITATFTLGYPFGSGVVVPGTGMLLGNTMTGVALGLDRLFDTTWEQRRAVEARWAESVETTVWEGGTVVAPAFAIGRTQEMLLVAAANGITPYADGMGVAVTKTLRQYPSFLRDPEAFREAMGRTRFVTGRDGQRKRIAAENALIVTTSGMLAGGPVHTYLPEIRANPTNLVTLTGYQVEGTPGRELQERGQLELNGRVQPVSARVESYDFSAHADREGLESFLDAYRDARVLVNHGDRCAAFAADLRADGVAASAPEIGDRIEV